MTKAIEAKLRQERALLWRARNLHRQFLGDSTWIPCGSVETAADKWIFEPRIPGTSRNSSMNRYDPSGMATPLNTTCIDRNGNGESSSAANSVKGPQMAQEEQGRQAAGGDTEMEDAQKNEAGVMGDGDGQTKDTKIEDADATVGDLPAHTDKDSGTQANGHNEEDSSQGQPADTVSKTPFERVEDREKEATQADHERGSETQEDTEMQDASSPEPPRRMATRARTNATNPQTEGEIATHSPSPSSDALGAILTPHPLFLVPEAVRADANFGLPPNEAEETRRLLWSYVQKQEETVRGFEHMLESLLRACRMKDDVFEWCKAEGHLGEMSDGEDWYDREKWGLAEGEELKKGADEDEIEAVDDTRATGKRGRRRA